MKRQMMIALAVAIFCAWATPSQATPPRGIFQAARYGGGGDCGCEGVYHEPDCGCEPGCGMEVSCCDPCCRPCCLRIIPAVVHGTHKLLNEIFCCHRCYVPCCDSGCEAGCDECWGGSDPYSMSHANAHWESPSARTARAYQNWDITRHERPVVTRSSQRVVIRESKAQESSVVKSKPSSLKKPNKLSTRTASAAKPIDSETEADEEGVVRRTSYNEPAKRRVPHNPLRD